MLVLVTSLRLLGAVGGSRCSYPVHRAATARDVGGRPGLSQVVRDHLAGQAPAEMASTAVCDCLRIVSVMGAEPAALAAAS